MNRRAFVQSLVALAVSPLPFLSAPQPKIVSDSWDDPTTDVISNLRKLREQWEAKTGWTYDNREVAEQWLMRHGPWDYCPRT